MVEFDSAYKYLTRDFKETIKFSFLSLLSLLIPFIGSFFFQGLMIDVLRKTINNDNKIPKVFNNFGRKTVNGLKVMLFGILISIPIFIIPLIFNSNGQINDLSIIISIIFISFIIFLYPILLANFAKKKDFNAFFEFKYAFNVLKNNFKSYLKMLLTQIIYSIGSFILLLISSITIIGPIILMPLTSLIYMKILGEWYKNIK